VSDPTSDTPTLSPTISTIAAEGQTACVKEGHHVDQRVARNIRTQSGASDSNPSSFSAISAKRSHGRPKKSVEATFDTAEHGPSPGATGFSSKRARGHPERSAQVTPSTKGRTPSHEHIESPAKRARGRPKKINEAMSSFSTAEDVPKRRSDRLRMI